MWVMGCRWAHFADGADVVCSFLFLSLLSHAEQQGGILLIALHPLCHETLHSLQELEGNTWTNQFVTVTSDSS